MAFIRRYGIIIGIAILIGWCNGSCQKQIFTTSAKDKLSFSADTFNFDTVFTTVGSAVGSFKIYNPHNKSINISNITLASGAYFKLNIDGVPGNTANNVSLRPHDSTYIFVTVKVDPTAANTPFVVYDSVKFLTNGNKQHVILQAYGQNAHFIKGHIPCNATWVNDKPYVLAAGCQVDSGCLLTINGGCRIYGHPGVFLKVYGTINIIGQSDSLHHVYFRGDRLEHFYDDVPGKWGGMVFYRGSTGNSIDYTVFNEGTQAIVAGIPGNTNYKVTDYGNSTNIPDITMKHSTIKNFYTNGILCINAHLNIENSLIYNTGSSAVSIGLGGTYTFNACSILNYGSITVTHQDPNLSFTNYLIANNIVYTNDLNIQIYNSIIHGNITGGNEVGRDSVTKNGNIFNYTFQNCLLASTQAAPKANFINCVLNQDPQFNNPGNNIFTLISTSPCVGKGGSNTPYDDITGKARIGTPDIGAYQHH